MAPALLLLLFAALQTLGFRFNFDMFPRWQRNQENVDEGNPHVHMDRSRWRNNYFTRICLQHCDR